MSESVEARQASTLTIASLSIIFYGALAAVSFIYFHKFRLIQLRNNASIQYYRSNVGKFDDSKVLFFLVLGCSALLDIPIYFGCIVEGGPNDCSYGTAFHEVFWFMHLIAVCGYGFSIIVPCILWSDMINKKDGKLFWSKYPADNTKRFFQFSLLLYILNTFVDILVGFIYYRASDPDAYQNGNMVDAICTLLEPIIIFGIAVGCLWCSVRLQLHVTRARLGLKTELRFLLYMNVTMGVIMFSYLARALFVLRLVPFMPDSYNNTFKVSYLVWILSTRWLPYIFCSFCLVSMMRASGEEVAARQGNLRLKAPSESESVSAHTSRSNSGKGSMMKLVVTNATGCHLSIEETKDSNHNSGDHNMSILSQSYGYGLDEDSPLSESLLIDRGGFNEEGRISGSYNSPSFWGGFLPSTSPPRVSTLQQERTISTINTSPRIFSNDSDRKNPMNSEDYA